MSSSDRCVLTAIYADMFLAGKTEYAGYLSSWSKALIWEPHLLDHETQGANWRMVKEMFQIAGEVLEETSDG